MTNRVVLRFVDGRVVKGSTADFSPGRPAFHLVPLDGASTRGVEVKLDDLKAVFFVRDFAGDASRVDRQEFPTGGPLAGRRIRVRFKDGEILLGITQGYQASRPGFFLVPADPASNNERCYVVAAAVAEVTLL